MEATSSQYRVHQCSKCPGDTEYFCNLCPCELCSQCQENHVHDKKTIHNKVLIYRNRFKYIPQKEICVRHPNNEYRSLCGPCQVPMCDFCSDHQFHMLCASLLNQTGQTQTIWGTYIAKRQKHRRIIHIIRNEAFKLRPDLLNVIHADVITCQRNTSLNKSCMLTKARKLKEQFGNCIESQVSGVMKKIIKEKIKLIERLNKIMEFEEGYEQSAISPVQFILSMKSTAFPDIHDTCTRRHSQPIMTESLNKKDVMKTLYEIQITQKGKRSVKIESLLKMMSCPELYQSLTVKGINCCLHISCITPDRVWVSDEKDNLVLANKTGDILHLVKDLCSDLRQGIHAVNSKNELIYIDREFNIRKLSMDMKTNTKFIKKLVFTIHPRCLYCSPVTGDLLVGYYHAIARYDSNGKLTQVIPIQNINFAVYGVKTFPSYIAENVNGDIVLSDSHVLLGFVEVIDREGKYRFLYPGQEGSKLFARGICTDPLSHILICDQWTATVHIIDKDGEFLTKLLIRPSGIFEPHSLCYDLNTHLLWVGSRSKNTVCAYSYITTKEDLTDQSQATVKLMESPSEMDQEGNVCQLKMLSPPEFRQSFTLTDIESCRHISFVIADWIWVSDDKYNLILTSTTSETLHRVDDLCRKCDHGVHTVNSDGELIYIDRNHNINRLSNDLKTITTFIETTDSIWKPQCVYWSRSNSDLLVTMYKEGPLEFKVTRYNQRGVPTQTIQKDKAGLDLYELPRYITENNNGDIVVSDCNAVVVTKSDGRHCFSYTGHPPGSGIHPEGICTDALSHIIVCVSVTDSVQILDKYGHFLSHLLTKSEEFNTPHCLYYDINTHCLWVGLRDKGNVKVFKLMKQEEDIIYEREHNQCSTQDQPENGDNFFSDNFSQPT